MATKIIEKRNLNLVAELKSNNGDTLIIRTSYVGMCWYDVEFYAHYYGYDVCRISDYEGLPKNEFREVYRFTPSSRYFRH